MSFALESGRIVVTPGSTGVVDDRRERMKAAGAKAWRTMDPAFQQLSTDEITAFIRGDAAVPVLKSKRTSTPTQKSSTAAKR